MLTGHRLVSEGSVVVFINLAQSVRSKRDHRSKLLTTANLKGSLLILGKGYTGGALASHLQEKEDWQVTPMSDSIEGATVCVENNCDVVFCRSVTCTVRSARADLREDPHLLLCSFQDSSAPG